MKMTQNISKTITTALLCLNFEEHNMKDTIIPSIKKPREEFQEESEKRYNFQATATSQKLMREM